MNQVCASGGLKCESIRGELNESRYRAGIPGSPGSSPQSGSAGEPSSTGPAPARVRRLKQRATEAALLALAFFFFCQIGQKIRQRLLPRKLCGSVGLESVFGHLNAQRFALAAHIPAPAIRVLAASGSNDVIVGGVSDHTSY
jgi:hypothetical protein